MRAQDPKLVRIRRGNAHAGPPRRSSQRYGLHLELPGRCFGMRRRWTGGGGFAKRRRWPGAGLVGFGARVRAGDVPSLRWALGRWAVPWLSGLDKDDDGCNGSSVPFSVLSSHRRAV